MIGGDEPHKSMDPPDETPEFDHGDRSKRRRIASADPFMDAISSRTAHTNKQWQQSSQTIETLIAKYNSIPIPLFTSIF